MTYKLQNGLFCTAAKGPTASVAWGRSACNRELPGILTWRDLIALTQDWEWHSPNLCTSDPGETVSDPNKKTDYIPSANCFWGMWMTALSCPVHARKSTFEGGCYLMFSHFYYSFKLRPNYAAGQYLTIVRTRARPVSLLLLSVRSLKF